MPYVKIIATLEQALHKASGTALRTPLEIDLHKDRERKLTSITQGKEVLVGANS